MSAPGSSPLLGLEAPSPLPQRRMLLDSPECVRWGEGAFGKAGSFSKAAGGQETSAPWQRAAQSSPDGSHFSKMPQQQPRTSPSSRAAARNLLVSLSPAEGTDLLGERTRMALRALEQGGQSPLARARDGSESPFRTSSHKFLPNPLSSALLPPILERAKSML